MYLAISFANSTTEKRMLQSFTRHFRKTNKAEIFYIQCALPDPFSHSCIVCIKGNKLI